MDNTFKKKYGVRPFVTCDTDGCDFKEFVQEGNTVHHYINKPCPKCQANLLTQEDYDNYVEMLANQRTMLSELGMEEMSSEQLHQLADDHGVPVEHITMFTHQGKITVTTEE